MDNGKIQYVIELLKQGDTKSAVAALKDVDDQAKKTQEGLRSLADTAKSALATIGSVVAVREAISAFVSHEQAAARLNGTLKATGQFSAQYVKDLADQRAALKATTDATGGQLTAIQTLLISFGATQKDLPGLTKSVLDLSAGMGVDANTAALELSKALEGIDGPLKRMGITFDENAGRGEKMSSAITQIAQRFGGLAEAIHNTPAGELNAMEKSLEGLKVQFGELALEGLGPSIARTTQLAQATKDFLKNGSLAGEYTKELISITAALSSLMLGVKGFQMLWAFTAGDAIKNAGGLKAALESLPKTIQIGVIALATYQIAKAGSAMAEAYEADQNKDATDKDLSKQNDSRRAALDKILKDRFGENPNRVGMDQMSAITGPLDAAAELKPVYRKAWPTGREYGEPEMQRDEGQYADAISRANRQLNPQLALKTPEETAAAPQNAALLADQKLGLEELEKLQAKMNAEALEGFEKQRVEAKNLYDQQSQEIDNIVRKRSLDEATGFELQIKALETYEARQEQITKAEAQAKAQAALQQAELEARIREEGLAGIQRAVQAEKDRYQIENLRINALKESDVTSGQRDQLHQLNQTQFTGAMNQITKPGAQEDQMLIAAKKGLWAEHQVEVDAAFEERKQKLTAYYEWKLQQAQDDEDKQLDIAADEQDRLDQLEQQHQAARSQMTQQVNQIAEATEMKFASGMSNALVSFISGTKSAGEAFREFAAQFLEQVAQMILQMLILNAVKAGLSSMGFGGGGGAFGGGGGGGASVFAKGGMVTPAATGIMLAASGVQGVSDVNGPTYFPNYNVLAGEAGKEVMTVMARPKLGTVNGQPVMLGNVGASRLAIISQDSLSQMVNTPRAMAAGGMAGAMDSLGGNNNGVKVSSVSPQASGKIVVELTPHPDYEARIVQNSISGAQAQVATDLQTDTPIRRNSQQILG